MDIEFLLFQNQTMRTIEYIINILPKYILPQPENSVLARNAGLPMLGRMRQEYCQEFEDSETLSQTTREVQHAYPLHLMIVLADTGRKTHRETEHTTAEPRSLAPPWGTSSVQ